LPSAENEWQLAHTGRLSITTRLRASPTLRILQATSGMASAAKGFDDALFQLRGINGTSR